MIGVYKITSPSGKIYVGSSMDIEKRWSYYKRFWGNNQPKLYNSLRKYGVEKHIFEVVLECPIYLLLQEERRIGLEYAVLGKNGLNGVLPKVGENRQICSDDTRTKMSISNKNYTKNNPEIIAIRKESRRLTLLNNPSVLIRLSRASKKKWADQSFSSKRIQGIREYWGDDENRTKQSDKKKAHLSNKDNLEKHREARCVFDYVIQNIISGELYKTKSVSLFSTEHNLQKSKLLNTFLGKNKHGVPYPQHKGYKIISKDLIKR